MALLHSMLLAFNSRKKNEKNISHIEPPLPLRRKRKMRMKGKMKKKKQNGNNNENEKPSRATEHWAHIQSIRTKACTLRKNIKSYVSREVYRKALDVKMADEFVCYQ